MSAIVTKTRYQNYKYLRIALRDKKIHSVFLRIIFYWGIYCYGYTSNVSRGLGWGQWEGRFRGWFKEGYNPKINTIPCGLKFPFCSTLYPPPKSWYPPLDKISPILYCCSDSMGSIGVELVYTINFELNLREEK